MNAEQKTLFYAKTSLVLGIVAIVTLVSVYIPLIAGGISIILAVISRGSRKSFSSTALAGLITSLIGISLEIMLIVGSIHLYNTVPELREEINLQIEQMTGQTLDEDFKLTDFFSLPVNK